MMELMRRIGATLQGLVYENRKLGLHIYVCRYLFIYLWLIGSLLLHMGFL